VAATLQHLGFSVKSDLLYLMQQGFECGLIAAAALKRFQRSRDWWSLSSKKLSTTVLSSTVIQAANDTHDAWADTQASAAHKKTIAAHTLALARQRRCPLPSASPSTRMLSDSEVCRVLAQGSRPIPAKLVRAADFTGTPTTSVIVAPLDTTMALLLRATQHAIRSGTTSTFRYVSNTVPYLHAGRHWITIQVRVVHP
jgi:hypothetical protein